MSYKTKKDLRDTAVLQLARRAENNSHNQIYMDEVDDMVRAWEQERDRFELYCCQFYDWLSEQTKNETLSPDCDMTTAFRIWYEHKAPWNRIY